MTAREVRLALENARRMIFGTRPPVHRPSDTLLIVSTLLSLPKVKKGEKR